MILLIDNYDSFTYNLVQYLRDLGEEVQVRRNDAIRVDQIAELRPTALVISPGPGNPRSAGICLDVVRQLGPHLPLLGVCLGHQCIGEALGGTVTAARSIMHGKTSLVQHDGRGVFQGLKQPLTVTRYHSLAVSRLDLPSTLEVSAWTTDGDGAPLEIMGLRHRHWPIEGVQFHPEAILTEFGHEMLANFLQMARSFAAIAPPSPHPVDFRANGSSR